MEIKTVLPDTNVLILGLSGKEPYASFLKSAITSKSLVLSAIVVAEFLCGATEREKIIFLALTEKFPILPVDLATAQLGASYRKIHLRTKKKLILPDCLIAATCVVNKAALATLNRKDYPIKELRIVSDFSREPES